MGRILYLVAFLFLSSAASAQDIRVYKINELIDRISNNDTVYVVNFWATWCGPCVAELPEFDKLKAQFADKPVKILLVSLDFADEYKQKVPKFIKKKKLQHEVGWLNETDANYFIPKIDNRWQGSIPATLISYKKTEYKNFFEGTVRAEQLSLLIAKQLAL